VHPRIAVVHALSLILAAAASAVASEPLVRTVTSFPDDQVLPYLGNGMIGYRIKPVPFLSWKGVATGYVNSFEDEGFETLNFGPYPFAMNFRLGGAPALRDVAERIRVERQSLDMRCGELTTELTFPLGGGTARATVLQFVSRTLPTVSCQEVRLTVPEAGVLSVDAGVVTGPWNKVYANTPPANEKVTDVMIGFAATKRPSRCGVSLKVDFGAAKVTRLPFEKDKPQLSRRFQVEVGEGQTVVIRTIAATVTSVYHPEPNLESCRLVNYAASIGFEALRARNRRAWDAIWKSRVRIIGGDEHAQEYLDCALYYLFSSAHRSCRTSIGPFGVSQALNYYGHVFWDTDIYMMPALLLVDPDTAKMTVDYRVRNLEQAVKRAQSFGFAGALYPWESDTSGAEATPSTVDTGWMQQHINLCVAAAAWWYQQAAGDRQYARESVWPILKAVAEWTVTRVEKTNRGYEIRNIMSSQEGMTVDNSCYVNGLAGLTLGYAAECAKLVGAEADPRWADIAAKMYIPTGAAPADAGIEGDIIWMHEKGWVSGPSTDMFLIGFPFDLPLDRGLLRRTFAFHSHLPDADTLSMGVAFIVGDAAFVGDRDAARHWFDRMAAETMEPVWGMGVEYTGSPTACFVTTMGAALQSAMMAFTGIRFEPENWTKYDACLPAGWEKIEVDRIYLGRKPYRLEAVSGRKATLTPIRE
jgi:trehalose/maltose hydrolase-like predicted phosphorylase